MKMDKNVRADILERIQNNASITIDEVVSMLDAHADELDIERLIANEKKSAARKVIASLHGKDKVRTHFALCDQEHTFVNIEHCDGYEKLVLIEKQLKEKRNGLNRSLGKVAYLKKAFGKCVAINGARSDEATALASKLYAMADELQSLVAVQLSA